MRWKNTYPSTRRWLDRGNPRDAGEWYACQTASLIFHLWKWLGLCRFFICVGLFCYSILNEMRRGFYMAENLLAIPFVLTFHRVFPRNYFLYRKTTPKMLEFHTKMSKLWVLQTRNFAYTPRYLFRMPKIDEQILYI